jgi:hypothetical protein
MSRQNALNLWRKGNASAIAEAIAKAYPPPPAPIVAPLSGRVPAVGDELEVIIYVANLAARTARMDRRWVRDRVSELRFGESAPGFTTAERGMRPRLNEEGREWRWPSGETKGSTP